ncbi:GNAT family N-acetyltransferase [Streptomyces sp. URMC 124]|uniref:GNAT family N-acetyltransferase n=1 Tax=Streptomyces sp. URMC 124 TaxID=3423405 RepID=UPI003F1AECE1
MYSYQWIETAEDLPGDVPGLVSEVSRTDPFIGLPPDPAGDQVQQLVTTLTAGLGSGRKHLLVIRTESGASVGCVAMTRPATANQRHIAELTTGAVHPEHRGRGIVPAALCEIARRAEEVGIELLRLDVREGIPAEKVWRRFGFAEYGRLPDYGRVDGESYAGVYLAQRVAQLKEQFSHQEA